jgi:hypothetical protein
MDTAKGSGGERIGLVGCVKGKQSRAAPAADLYTSALFKGRRRWVAQTCDRWFILSAKHGLVLPSEVLEPYDETLNDVGRAGRREWSQGVLASLRRVLGDLGGRTFEIHAGATYWDFGLCDGLLRAGAAVEIPTEHLRQGEQRALYRDGPGRVKATTP